MTSGDAHPASVKNLVGTIDLSFGTSLVGTRIFGTFQPSLFSALSSNDRDRNFSAALVLTTVDSMAYRKSRKTQPRASALFPATLPASRPIENREKRSLAPRPCCLLHCQLHGPSRIAKNAASYLSLAASNPAII